MASLCSKKIGRTVETFLGLSRQIEALVVERQSACRGYASLSMSEAHHNQILSGKIFSDSEHFSGTGPMKLLHESQSRRGIHIGSRSLTLAVPTPTNGRKSYLVDTLALVRRLEAEGLTGKQAEAITNLITDVLQDSLETAASTFVSKPDMQKAELLADAAISKVRTELQSHQDLRFTGLQRELETIKTDIDKVKSEIRYEVDKVTAGQRLDLNLERGRVKEDMSQQAQELSNLTNKLDREINNLKAQLEAAKFEIIRYCIGTLVSVSAIGLGLLRILM